MNLFRAFLSLSALLFLLSAPSAQAAPQAGSATGKQSGALDTSRDAKAHGPTADQQKENSADREMTRKIRRAVVADKSLSVMAHQAKIITVGGQVTLRGSVRSEDEKKSIESKAAEVAGSPDKVKSELSVSSGQTGDAAANKAASKTKN